MRWIEAGRPSVSVVLGAEAGRVERTAAQMLVDEVRERSGVTLPVVGDRDADGVAGGLVILGTPETNRLIAQSDVRAEADERGEAIAVRTGEGRGRPAVFAVGAGPRGALYAAVELLDRLEYSESGVDLPTLDVSHRPSFVWRSWSQSGSAIFNPALESHLDLFKRNLHYAARRRGNVVQVGHWPDRIEPLVGHRHFPELYDASKEPERDRARARAREVVALAADHGF
jgi:hypothetical protein